MIKVSVIVPVYNGEKTIKKCLESICAQTLEEIEIIVVNDGSEDNTLREIKSADDMRISVITTENRGQGLARSRGIDTARGEFLAFVDADDVIDKNMLSEMYEAAKSSGADVVQCNIEDVYPDGTSRTQLEMNNETVRITDRGEYLDLYFTPCRHSYEVCNKLISREAAGDLRFADTRKYFSEDLLFNLGLIERIKTVTFIDKPFYRYSQNDTSHLHTDCEKRLKCLEALFHDYIAEAPEDMKRAVSYTAAMVLSYSAGDCSESRTARDMFAGDEFSGYVLTALERKCKMSHRLFLTAMSIAPVNGRSLLCRGYAGRWRQV